MAKVFNTITLEGIHFTFDGKGGGCIAKHTINIPEEAKFASFDANTLTLNWTVPQEDADPITGSHAFTLQEIEDAKTLPLAPVSIDAIKDEAHRRIVAIIPEWKQRNFLATGLTYSQILQEGGSLTAEQQANRTHMESVWAQVQAIRLKSDEIESMSPIPNDYKNDAYWV